MTGGLRPVDELLRTDLGEGNRDLRLSVEVKDLPVIRLFKWHEERTPTELTVVHQENTLVHVVVQCLRHSVKGPYIAIQGTDHVKVTS